MSNQSSAAILSEQYPQAYVEFYAYTVAKWRDHTFEMDGNSLPEC